MRTVLILLTGMTLIGCSPAASAAPSTIAGASPKSAAPSGPTLTSAPAPTAAPTATSRPSPTVAPTPTVASTATPAASFADCALPKWRGDLPSGRLVDIEVRSASTVDKVVFKFQPGGDNPGIPTGNVAPAAPPFTQSGSGQAIKVAGDQFLQVKFQNMTLEDASGAVYKGDHDIKPGFATLRQVVNYDEFEGYSGWIVGMDRPTCVTVINDPVGMTVTLRIAHP
jgi:hypothetical protein